ncbi:hypothetical protein ONT16_08800 [Prevotella copri]|uniref:Uncharacterized protein n=1 Tax=Segatella copri TaxID=165179 RepID=A0AAP3BC90_9BACT|nr:hypothetical protein [Segatella copri]MCW4128353.1 hypothetical protein [Segatella copri]MCW4415861.1 hypothetical protein [Segatella copri]MCW4421279.1 hypothetical protein [Segatella copri]
MRMIRFDHIIFLFHTWMAMVVIASVAVSKSSFPASSYLLSPSFRY